MYAQHVVSMSCGWIVKILLNKRSAMWDEMMSWILAVHLSFFPLVGVQSQDFFSFAEVSRCRTTFLIDGEETFSAIADLIERAEHTLMLCFW